MNEADSVSDTPIDRKENRLPYLCRILYHAVQKPHMAISENYFMDVQKQLKKFE